MTESAPGRLYVMSAPSGCGKTTVVRRLLQINPELEISISCTTRHPRLGEKNGDDYHFVSQAEFDQMISKNELLEWATVHGNSYGTPRLPIQQWKSLGKDVILDLDVQGAMQVRDSHPRAILIFLLPPSMAALEERLKGRGTETAESLQIRLTRAKQEMSESNKYDFTFVNNNVEEVAQQISELIAKKRRGESK